MNESNIKGISFRGILALIITVATCALAIWLKNLDVLDKLAFLVLGFYFGQKTNPQNIDQTKSTEVKP